MDNIRFISADQMEKTTQFSELVEALKKGFQTDIETPLRHHHDYANPSVNLDSTLLLMPSWEAGKKLGVKIVTVSPENGRYNLPSIHGMYLLMDAEKGMPVALLEGKVLTGKRTAAASALASSFLSRPASESLLMIGTGALAPNLIQAHLSQRAIKTVWIWGRKHEKALALKHELNQLDVEIIAVKNKDEYIPKADIISCATLSKSPMIDGDLLREGQHIDLVGAYKTDMRESDNQAILRSSLFVDTFQGMNESGDIAIPIKEGIIKENTILADLADLCKGLHIGRLTEKEITVFKSVGHASEDLIAANYYFNKLKHE